MSAEQTEKAQTVKAQTVKAQTVKAQTVKAWLRERGAERIDHPGGTLYAHLGRVHDRLGALGHDQHVRLAGLAHAAYGTDGFDLSLLDVTDRSTLRAGR